MEFGYKNIQKFEALAGGDVSQALKGFVANTGVALQRNLEQALSADPSLAISRSRLFEAAYKSHSASYMQGGFGSLSLMDKGRVAITPDFDDSFFNTQAYPVFVDTAKRLWNEK
jgi:hypothetical protein